MKTQNDFRVLGALTHLNAGGYHAPTPVAPVPAPMPPQHRIAEDGWAMDLPAGWRAIDGFQLVRESEPECAEAVYQAFEDGCGNYLCTDRYITFDGDISAALIPGVAIARAEDGVFDSSPTAVALTRNCGFQHVGIDKEGKTVAEVPVCTPVIVGGTDQPSAVLVPFSSIEALQDGRDFIDAMIKTDGKAKELFQKSCLESVKGACAIPEGDPRVTDKIQVVQF